MTESSINQLTWEWAQTLHLNCQYLPEIDSTNRLARTEFWELDKKEKLYVADHQSEGKGRYSRTWSNLGQGEVLLSTWCFRVDQIPQPVLTARIGLKLFESLSQVWPQGNFSIKAPNDLLLDSKKMCGLLIEINQRGTQSEVFVGMGMNVFNHPEVDQPSTHLSFHQTLTKETWFEFCSIWLKNLRSTLSDCARSTLSPEERKGLTKALNRGKGSEKVLDVDTHCNLIFENETRSWMDL